MIEEIVRLITNAAPGIDKDLERILELIYKYAAEAREDEREQMESAYVPNATT